MGRRPRIYYPGAIYHVMARGVDGRNIFVDDHDRAAFLDGMRIIAREASAEIIAYCLMGNHFHLAVKVGAVPLSAFMQRLLTAYCMRFNRRHNRTGHLFQARYRALLCLDDDYLARLIRYIHLNPVRAGFVSSPGDWHWSSFKPAQADADGYSDFDPWANSVSRDIDMSRSPIAGKVDLEVIGSAVASRSGLDPDALRSDSRHRTVVAAKRLFVGEAFRVGYTLKSVAKWLNTSRSSVSRYARENTAPLGGLTPNGGEGGGEDQEACEQG
jgi:REP element-mobilizing transposase RayT